MKNKIEKRIEINAPIAVVWKALSDYREFGEWFRVNVDRPFAVGQKIRGKLTYPGFENYPWEIVVQHLDPEHHFSFTWHPYAIDQKRDYSKETPTLIEFKLEKTNKGTVLHLTESGFDKIPDDRREEAYAMNSEGWAEQMKNIEAHVVSKLK
jgi:uncharacterized protein YndB with AHSA1/START domain